MKLKLIDGLPFAEAVLIHGNSEVKLAKVLIDTGSATTLISADKVIDLGLGPSPHDKIHAVRGVGGTEFVYEKYVDCIQVEEICSKNFRVQVGAMDYGFEIDGIIGMDFLLANKAIIDTGDLHLYHKIS